MLVVEKAHAGAETAFRAYGWPLYNMTSLKYLRHLLMDTEDNCSQVVYNLRKVLKKLEWTSQILGQEGADKRTSGKFFKVVI